MHHAPLPEYDRLTETLQDQEKRRKTEKRRRLKRYPSLERRELRQREELKTLRQELAEAKDQLALKDCMLEPIIRQTGLPKDPVAAARVGERIAQFIPSIFDRNESESRYREVLRGSHFG